MGIKDRGFASMDRQRQREIASKGGRSAHEKGTAHEWTSDEAREAGRKGGLKSQRRRTSEMEPESAGQNDVVEIEVGAERKNPLW
jgi:uncharacterized protein